MNQDYLDPINSEGMPDMANSFLALDFLLSVKTGVRNYAFALSETATPEVRSVLRAQLDRAISLHEELSQLMIDKGWLHPVDTGKQYQLDVKSAETTAQIARMKLFPDDTSRLGTFATPDY
ncbi:spore coat protein [Paenibacillus ihbetae]|uniref:Spore coat protein n=1 Tax=Paenibacillus ihbetae TaxID=1870820 RepID=A0A1B2DXN3_9BACL|nr:spore coat protein [Paenibacillus ihbetae]ANY72451.1 spore gernimation protein GerQ [Paenibacillus ihbetae]OOC58360.1 spore coat protein [Paenibacillus ihbetae]